MSGVEVAETVFEALAQGGGRELVRRYDELFVEEFEFDMKLLGHESGVALEQDVSFLVELRDERIARVRSFLTPAEGRKAAHAAT
jgi:hypothetical protein